MLTNALSPILIPLMFVLIFYFLLGSSILAFIIVMIGFAAVTPGVGIFKCIDYIKGNFDETAMTIMTVIGFCTLLFGSSGGIQFRIWLRKTMKSDERRICSAAWLLGFLNFFDSNVSTSVSIPAFKDYIEVKDGKFINESSRRIVTIILILCTAAPVFWPLSLWWGFFEKQGAFVSIENKTELRAAIPAGKEQAAISPNKEDTYTIYEASVKIKHTSNTTEKKETQYTLKNWWKYALYILYPFLAIIHLIVVSLFGGIFQSLFGGIFQTSKKSISGHSEKLRLPPNENQKKEKEKPIETKAVNYPLFISGFVIPIAIIALIIIVSFLLMLENTGMLARHNITKDNFVLIAFICGFGYLLIFYIFYNVLNYIKLPDIAPDNNIGAIIENIKTISVNIDSKTNSTDDYSGKSYLISKKNKNKFGILNTQLKKIEKDFNDREIEEIYSGGYIFQSLEKNTFKRRIYGIFKAIYISADEVFSAFIKAIAKPLDVVLLYSAAVALKNMLLEFTHINIQQIMNNIYIHQPISMLVFGILFPLVIGMIIGTAWGTVAISAILASQIIKLYPEQFQFLLWGAIVSTAAFINIRSENADNLNVVKSNLKFKSSADLNSQIGNTSTLLYGISCLAYFVWSMFI